MADFENYKFFNPTQTFVGGLIQGITQGKFAKQQMAQEAEEKKARLDLLKAQQKVQLQKFELEGEKAARDQQIADLIAGVLGDGGGSGGPGGSSRFEVGEIDPMKPGLKLRPTQFTTIQNVRGPGGTPVTVRTPSSAPGIYPQYVPPQRIEIPDGRGGKRAFWVTPDTGQGAPGMAGEGGAPGGGGGYTTELGPGETPMGPAEVMNFSNAEGQHPPIGMSPNEAISSGFQLSEKPMAGETAGKLSMMNQAISDIDEAAELLFPKEGEYDRTLAVSAKYGAPEWLVPGSQQVLSKLWNAVNAKLRLETGAQANPSEIEDIKGRFFPGWKDNYTSASDKIKRLKQFMQTGQFLLDPSGKILIVEKGGKPSSLGGLRPRKPSAADFDK